MLIYNSIFLILILLRYTLRGQVWIRDRLYSIALLGMFLFSAFRFEVGCDWGGYFVQWKAQEISSFELALQNVEPLWWALMDGMQAANLSYLSLNVASSAIFFLGVHVLARRQPDPLGFLIMLFPILIINMPMSGIRQGAAIGVICIAFASFLEKKVFWFAACVLFASAFHNSAIVFMLLLPLVGGEYTSKRLALAGILAIPGALALIVGGASERASIRYIGSGVDAAGAAFRVALLLITSILYFLLLRKPWKWAFPGDYKLVSICALIMAAMIALVPVSSVIGDRLGYYLIPIQTIIFARIPYLESRRLNSFFSAAPYLCLFLIFVTWTSLSWHFEQCYVPYQNWIFGTPPSSLYIY